MRLYSRLSLSAVVAAVMAFSGCDSNNETVNQPTPAPSTPVPPSSPAVVAAQKVPTQLPASVRPLHYSIAVTPDAANLRFSGTVAIDIEVLEATDSITLNAADLEFQSVAIGDNGAQSTAVGGKPSIDAAKQTATFALPSKLATGKHVLTIKYTGPINKHATGFFALDYDAPDGKKRALYTQFEATDARRFFPGWDEPSFRASYDLRVTIPAGQNAVSNMPEASREQKPDGTVEVRFATTPAMSSYLVFLAVGEFDRVTKDAAGTRMRGKITA